MKNSIIYLIISILFIGMVQAQPHRGDLEKIEAARIAMITNRLDLTPEEAQLFWPVYNEFSGKRKALKELYEKKRRSMDMATASEEEKEELVEMHMDMKEKQLKLEKEYSKKILEVISAEQLISLHKAEADFRMMLLKKLKERNRRMDKRSRNMP